MCLKCRNLTPEARRLKHRNRASFACGPDTRRHVFTQHERRMGFRNAIIRHERTPIGLWLRERVRCWYGRLRQRILAERDAEPIPY